MKIRIDTFFITSLLFTTAVFFLHVYLIPPYLGVGATGGGDEPFHFNNIVLFDLKKPLAIPTTWNPKLLQELVKYEREKLLLDNFTHQAFETTVDTSLEPESKISSQYNYGKLYYAVTSLFFDTNDYKGSLLNIRLFNLIFLIGGLYTIYKIFKEKIPFVMFITLYSIYSYTAIVNPDAMLFLFSSLLSIIFYKLLARSSNKLLIFATLTIFGTLGLAVKQNLSIYASSLLVAFLTINYFKNEGKINQKIILFVAGLTTLFASAVTLAVKMKLIPEFLINAFSINVNSLNPFSFVKFLKLFFEGNLVFWLDRTLPIGLYVVLTVIYVCSIFGFGRYVLKNWRKIETTRKMFIIATIIYLVIYFLLSFLFFTKDPATTVLNPRHLIPILPELVMFTYLGLKNVTNSKLINNILVTVLIFIQVFSLFRFIFLYLIPRYYL